MSIQAVKLLLKGALPRHHFARSVVVLIGGTVGAQGLTILIAPLLTRLYGPDDFGLLAAYAGLLALWSVVASLRYELAIPLPEDHRDAANLVLLCVLLTIISALLSTIVVAVFANPIAQTFRAPHLAPFLWLLPLGVFLNGTYKATNYWAMRQKNFSAIAATQVHQSFGKAFLQILGYKLGPGNLVFAQALSQGIGAGRLGRAFVNTVSRTELSLAGAKVMANRYRRFPIYSSGEGLLNTAGLQLPPLLFAALFSPAAAGLYALANQILSLPMSLIGGAVGQVFFSQAAQAHRDGTLSRIVLQLHRRLAHIGVPPSLLLMLVAPDLFALVFGSDWRQAGEFARWMIPWTYLVFVLSPLSTLFAVVERQVQGLTFQIVLVAARVLAIASGAYFFEDLLVSVTLFAVASALCWLGLLVWLATLCKIPRLEMLKPTIEAVGIGLLCILPFPAVLHLAREDHGGWMFAMFACSLTIVARYLYMLRKAY